MNKRLVLFAGVISIFFAALLIFSQESKPTPQPTPQATPTAEKSPVQETKPTPETIPPARKIPGITAEDRYPRGCVDCHVNYTDLKMDTRFKTMMAQWNEGVEPKLLALTKASAPDGLTIKGKHPSVPFALTDIPAKCMICHAKTSKTAPPFAYLIHNIHLTGGEQNHFLTIFQGECTHCHKLNKTSGGWTIPSAPES
jgi:hypothetical protein